MFLEVLVGLLAVMALFLGTLLLIRLQEERTAALERPRREEIIVRDSWLWPGRPLGPYYSHLPVRPLLYG
jgi:hypothetical protein